jgi:hypothetical protein
MKTKWMANFHAATHKLNAARREARLRAARAEYEAAMADPIYSAAMKEDQHQRYLRRKRVDWQPAVEFKAEIKRSI